MISSLLQVVGFVALLALAVAGALTLSTDGGAEVIAPPPQVTMAW